RWALVYPCACSRTATSAPSSTSTPTAASIGTSLDGLSSSMGSKAAPTTSSSRGPTRSRTCDGQLHEKPGEESGGPSGSLNASPVSRLVVVFALASHQGG